MDADDELIVVIVGEEEEQQKKISQFPVPFVIKDEPLDENELTDLIETAKKYGQRLDLVEENQFEEVTIKQEYEEFDENSTNIDDDDIDDDYVPKEEDVDDSEDSGSEEEEPKRLRWTFVAPSQRKSLVQELRQEYKELRMNDKALVNTLSEIMRNVRRPSPPRDYFIMNDILFECRKCGAMSESEQAAGRHYQEKHGPRYLVCYACGVDFRSTTNLYKHEKRCSAPDAVIVLKARAQCLGRKGRGRPFLPDPKDCILREPICKRFLCQECPSTFSAKVHLDSHENLHNGLRPYRCNQCNCAYTSEARLKRHVKKHTDEEFICDYCGRPFKLKAALVVHMNTHMPERKYGCDSCPRRFATKHALNNHVRRVHLNLPPACACPICPMSYPRMSLVRDHMKKKHGMSLMTRKMFFKALPTMSDAQLQQGMEIMKSSDTMYYFMDENECVDKHEES